MGKIFEKAKTRTEQLAADLAFQSNQAGTYIITTPGDYELYSKYPKLSEWVLDYAISESPSVKQMLLKGSGMTNALLSTLETVQSAYVAPSVSGIGPAKQMLTEWWFNPLWGQPRIADLRTIKQLARGHIGSMAIDAILDQIMQVDWQIVPKFRHQVDRPSWARGEEARQKAMVEDFLEDPNRNHDNFDTLLRMIGRSILESDDGTLIKVYEEYQRPEPANTQSAATGDIRQYTAQPAWDQVPVPGSPVVELFVEDGTSFLKQTDMHGYLMNYWQYSFVVPRRPVRFETNEIVYIRQNPRAGSPYGVSPFESLVETLKFIASAFLYNQHFYENSAIPALQIDYPLIKDPETLKKMGQYIENTFKGPESSFRTLVTNGGTVVKTLNLNPQQLQNLEMQTFYIHLALAKLKVPAVVLGIDVMRSGGGGGGGASTQSAIYRSRAIKPLMTLMENALNAQLIPSLAGVPSKRCLVQFKWGEITDLEELERTSKVDQVYLMAGVKTINEVRLREGLDGVPWGDRPFVPGAKMTGGLDPKYFGIVDTGGAGAGGKGSDGMGSTPMPGGGAAGKPASQENFSSQARNNDEGMGSQSQYTRNIGQGPAEGRGYGNIPGGAYKGLDDTARTIQTGLKELLKEARDRLQDGEDYDRMEKEMVGKAGAIINAIIPRGSPKAKEIKAKGVGDFAEILRDMALKIKAGQA